MTGRGERRREEVGDGMKHDRVSRVKNQLTDWAGLFLSHVARFASFLACFRDLMKLV
jgi:hypothetical protein